MCRLATSMSRWLPLTGERKDACAEEDNPVGRLESPKSFSGEGDGDGAEWSSPSPTPRMGEPSLVKDPGVKWEGRSLVLDGVEYLELDGFRAPLHVYKRR